MLFPLPDHVALQQNETLRQLIVHAIGRSGNWIPFPRYMELALYTPGLGYYCTGRRMIGREGDFITAPEVSPLFAQTLAVQVAELMNCSAFHIIECGAGSGVLAVQLLTALEEMASLPQSYGILEVSADLRCAQQEAVGKGSPHLANRVEWLDGMPKSFSGVVLANEVLDAIPFNVVAWRDQEILECGTCVDENNRFVWGERPAAGTLIEAARALDISPTSRHYVSEIGLPARAWISSWGDRLELGALVLIDYGFPRHEYYHPQRSEGTLMCHYRHCAHDDPYKLPGSTDITAHVDFTAIAEVGHRCGLKLLGYTSQAQFLLNCGLASVTNHDSAESVDHVRWVRGVHKLISPAEMGELIKVMVLARGIEAGLVGFSHGDRSHAL